MANFPDPLVASKTHRCVRRDTKTSLLGSLKDHSLTILHLLATIAFGLVLLYVVDGRDFAVGGSAMSGARRLSQPVVSALISIGLVAIRALSLGFIATAGWQMAFAVLARDGALLSDLTLMIKYRIAPWRHGSHGGLFVAMWLILLFSLPAQFASPLLTSAIKWIPIFASDDSGSTVAITLPGPSSPKWDQHNMYGNNRYYEVLGAVGLTSFASPTSFRPNGSTEGEHCAPSRARYNGLEALAINSTLETITVPYLKINSLKWVSSADEIDQDDFDRIRTIVKEPAETLVFSNASQSTNNPFWEGTDSGRLVLDNNRIWGPAPYDTQDSSYTYPSPVVRHGEQLVVVATIYGADTPLPVTPDFGPLDDIYQYCDSDTRECYIFARMEYDAGVIECRDCPIVLDNFVESTAPCTSSQTLVPLPDPLVDLSLAMIPEVLFYVKVANTTGAPSWQNIDAYTRGMISVAYQASWNSLTGYFSRDVIEDPSAVRFTSPQPVLRAEIDVARTVAWIILNAALTLSAMILVSVRSYYGGVNVKDAVVTALMMDTTDLTLIHDSEGLCNATELRGNDGKLRLRLEATRKGEDYVHPKLVRDIRDESPRKGYEAIALCDNP
ncbi:hypothetical protein F5Y18DRAFT_376583 [Xylariaceae sp. FL1019]|nr:hypothetical protein F5Y18DRAFT_376583 [Xylariaceae sp. FL1019]